ncbi:MAG: GatB/YqeY domain-containing protein [Bacillota bacterium]
MIMKKKLMNDLKEAMKNKNKLKKQVITMLKAEIKQIEVDERIDVDKERIMDIIASQIKVKRNALKDFKKAERQDLVEKTEKEIAILKKYLPKQLSKEELEKIIDETIQNVSATSMKDMGKVMGKVTSKVKGKAENSLVAEIVKSKLM